MKKTLPIAIIATSLVGLGSLTSCHDEDFDVSTAVLQERAFEQNFIKEFGKPSANQSWDFYAQKMESIRQKSGMTRATQAITVTVDTTISQPTQKWFTDLVDDWETALEEQHDNHTVGQNSYSLTSTGDFNIYAVRYAGAIETGGQYNLDFGLAYKDKDATGKELPATSEKYVDPDAGYDVVLTIDQTIQSITEKYLEQAVKENDCKDGGVIVVMEPKTGDILAMASSNGYDLNFPFEPNSEELKIVWDTLDQKEKNEALQKMWRNPAIADTYEPGSKFNIITTSIAL